MIDDLKGNVFERVEEVAKKTLHKCTTWFYHEFTFLSKYEIDVTFSKVVNDEGKFEPCIYYNKLQLGLCPVAVLHKQ
jgi:hypothetical protein